MTSVLHISADFPDALVANKTNAVRALVESQPDYRHVIYSLNRTNGLTRILSLPFGDGHTAVAYRAPPYGILHHTRLQAVARWIAADLKRRDILPDIIHCHKLTVEGLIGLELQRLIARPMIVSIQGDTDTKIINARPDLKSRFRDVVAASSAVVSVSRWPLAPISRALGISLDQCVVLPAITQLDDYSEAPVLGLPRLVSTFHLLSWHRKGADTLARACAIAAKTYPDITVDILGGGPPDTLAALYRTLKHLDPRGRIRLLGPVDQQHLASTFHGYAGYVMPSRRETYGMAYVEALLSGLPLVHSKGRGVDGVTPEHLGYACNPLSATDVAKGMIHLIAHEKELKAAVGAAQRDGTLELVRRNHIAAQYSALLDHVLA